MVTHLGTNHHHIEDILIPGWACDIDETISETTIPSFRDMMKEFGNMEGLTPAEMVTKYQYLENIPYWQEKQHHEWRSTYFHNPENCLHLEPKKDAVHTIKKVHAIKPLGAYVTARKYSLRQVTLDWKKSLNFTEAPLLMRTNNKDEHQRSKWKAQLLHHVYPQITGIVDDDPKLPGELDALHYKGFVIMFGYEEPVQTNFEIYATRDWKETGTILISR